MSEIRTLHQSSDYGQSSYYSSSLSNSVHLKIGGTENGNSNESYKRLGQTSSEQGEAARSFSIPGISIPSAFILEVFLSGVKCVSSSAFQTDPSHEGGKGATLDVRKGIFNNRSVALKRIKTDFFLPHQHRRYDRALADVLFELRVLSHEPFARHRNIPALLGFSLEPDDESGTAGGRAINTSSSNAPLLLHPVLLVEWATTDLNSYFLERQDQTPMHCAELVADIADGLQAMHTYGLSHADLKPDNVLLYADASSAYGLVAKLSDFGFSGSEQHQLPVGGDTPHWGAPGRAYTIENTECPGDVFSFGLVAMFVALKGNWDFRLNGAGVKDVERRRGNIRDAVYSHFITGGVGDDGVDGISGDTWFERWDGLLHRTVTHTPEGRLTTQGLGSVRQYLTGQDHFSEQRREAADRIIPFRGQKGWRIEKSPFILWTRIGATRGFVGSHSLALSIMEMLPPSVKRAIVNDIDSLKLGPLTIMEVRRSEASALRVVAILFLRLLTASKSGGLYVPGEARTSSPRANFILIGVMMVLFYQMYQTGIRRGGEVREARPDEVWRLTALGRTDEAIRRLEQNPALIRQFHRGYTLAHEACARGDPRLLEAILRLDRAAARLMNHFGTMPLTCAAMTPARGGTECIALLLATGDVDTAHVFSNGETILDTMYYQLLYYYFELPASRAFIASVFWLFRLKDKLAAFLMGGDDVDPQVVLKRVLSAEGFERALPNIEIAVERRRHLGNDFYEAMYERLEMLRRHTGPCESMRSVRAGIFLMLCLLESMVRTATVIFCAVVLICVLLSWSWEFVSQRGSWVFMGGHVSIVLYLLQLVGVMSAMARGSECRLDYRLMSLDGIFVSDLMIRDDSNLLTLLPLCLYVAGARRNKQWERVLTELEWIRASLGVPGSVYDPSGLDWNELRNHATARTVVAYWAQFKETTTMFGYIPSTRGKIDVAALEEALPGIV